jgi:hypothetical protein
MKENMVKSASVLTMTHITIKTYVAFRGGQATRNFANLQILGFTPLSQIRKFLRYDSPQIANPQIL